MIKKIAIGLGVVLLIWVCFTGYKIVTSRNLSPKGTATYNKDGLKIDLTYGRPFKKGRLIFGSKEEKALVPYGEYWRLGANESTEITFNKDVSFAGKPVKAGTYRMYVVPGENKWKVFLNTELGKWGYWEAEHKLDIAEVEVPSSPMAQEVEEFTIDISEGLSGEALVTFKWDKTQVSVPVQ